MATTIVTDLGTIELIGHMTPTGRRAVDGFLDRCARGRICSETFQSSMFEGVSDLLGMEWEYDPEDRKKGRVVSTVQFRKALWRRGSLRITDIELPQVVMAGIKGRRIGDVVEGAPFPDFTISHAVHDRHKATGKVTLRIRCDGETLAPIPRS